jgi:carboxymethylenebutenolidase
MFMPEPLLHDVKNESATRNVDRGGAQQGRRTSHCLLSPSVDLRFTYNVQMGQMINFDSGDDRYEGYLAIPKSGKGPGVIVLQEWWGLVDHIKDVAERFAAEGFVALAPDLYQGKKAELDEPDEAGKLLMALDIERTSEVLARAAQWLVENEAVTSEQVGVVGFCMGGQLSMFAACLTDHIGAAVNFYGIHPNVHPNFEELNAPLLGIFAEQDHSYATVETVKKMDEELTKLGKPHEFHTYPADHAFFNDTRPGVYNKAAAEDAWKKTLAFFRKNLATSKT